MEELDKILQDNFSYLKDPRIQINFGKDSGQEGLKLYKDISNALVQAMEVGITRIKDARLNQ